MKQALFDHFSLSLAATLAVTLLSATQALAQAKDGYPNRPVRMLVPNAPGGSLDASARLIQQLWQIPVSSTVVNRAGGEHAIAYTYLSQRAGAPYFLSMASPVLLSNPLSGRAQMTYTDVTPVATLITEYYLFVVRADSPLKSGRDMIEALKKTRMLW